MEKLSDGTLSVTVSAHGAELCSIIRNGVEYLWQADPKYWKRHSPVLFPIVGSLWEGVYRYEGKEYRMGQHGFARDMDFSLLRKSGDEVWYRLVSDEGTLEKYPFEFVLDIGYRLESGRIHVMWRVHNPGGRTMFYQIGAHPAFFYPGFDTASPVLGFFSFEGPAGAGERKSLEEFTYILIKEKGCADTETLHRFCLQDGMMPIDVHTFDSDAFIIEDGQVGKVTLHTPSGRPWLSLTFDAPELGLWSPPFKDAPFVCIEPWYGRCDRAGFSGDISSRDRIRSLAPGCVEEMSYTIGIL